MPLSLQEKQQEIERAVTAAAWRRPESVVIDLPNWFQITTPSSKQMTLNGVSRSELTAEEAPQRVAETVHHYRESNKNFRWILGPRATPTHLDKLLEDQGMQPYHSALGMIADIEKLDLDASTEIQVESVTLSNVHDYVNACALGWNSTEQANLEMLSDMLRCIQDHEHKIKYFLARYDGLPVAAGALLPMQKSGYLLGSSVVPQFRGKGVYRALVAKRLDVLRAMGISFATIQAMVTTSAPICQRLGFETVCDIRAYSYGDRIY